MADLEKVIYGIERCICHVPDACRDCWYDTNPYPECQNKLMLDAMELLKAQAAVKPIEREGFYYCGKCKYAFTVHRQKYCSACGMAVNWDE